MISTKTVALSAMASFFAITVSAQSYSSIADTAKINKRAADLSLTLAKLNARLVEAQNKTAEYQKKTAATQAEAVSKAQTSADKANTATSANTKDTRAALKEAKRADRAANDAKDAAKREEKNQNNIAELNTDIGKKQAELSMLQNQKLSLLGMPQIPVAAQDSSAQLPSSMPDSSK